MAADPKFNKLIVDGLVDLNKEPEYTESNSKKKNYKVRLILSKGKKDEVRCSQCGALLYKVLQKSGTARIEIKCRNCKFVNVS